MKIFISIIIITLVLSVNKLKAQSSGYMGKHIVLSTETTFSGSLFIMKKVWLKYGTNAEFAVSKNKSLGFSYIYYQTKFPFQSNRTSYYKYYKNSSTLKSHSFGINFYKYFDGNIAPLGDFLRIKLFYSYNYSNDFHENKIPIGYNKPYENEFDSYSSIGATIYFGRNRIFNDIIVVGYGFQLGIAFLNPINSSFDSDLAKFGLTEDFFSSVISLNVNIGIIL